MAFHKDLTLDNVHAIFAAKYATLAARNADTAWSSDIKNIGKVVIVADTNAIYLLLSTVPLWAEFTSTENNNLNQVLTVSNQTVGKDIIVNTGDKIVLTDAPALPTSAANKGYVDSLIPDIGANTAHATSDGKSHSDVILNNTHRLSDGKNHSDVILNNAHRISDGKEHSDVVLNNTHRLSDGKNHADVVLNNTHRGSDGKNHSDVILNNTHRSSDGKDHSDVELNNTHRTSSGTDHSFINQDVTIGSQPLFSNPITAQGAATKGSVEAYVGPLLDAKVNGTLTSLNDSIPRFSGTTGKILKAGTTVATNIFITDAGRLGVGTFSPSTKLEVNGTTRFDGDSEITGSLIVQGKEVPKLSSLVTEIYTMADFPAPTGDFITLDTGIYIIMESITTAIRFVINGGKKVVFRSISPSVTFTYTSYFGTMFTAINFTSFRVEDCTLAITADNARFFNLNSTGTVNIERNTFSSAGITAGMGRIYSSSQLIMRDNSISGINYGFDLYNINLLQVQNLGVISGSTMVGSVLALNGTVGSLCTISFGFMFLTPAASVLYIDPSYPAYVPIDTITNNGGSFFKGSDKSGTFTTSNLDLTQGVGSITDNGSGKSIFNSTSHGLKVGDKVTHTNFNVHPTYNGVDLIVTAVPTDATYEIDAISFIGSTTGTFDFVSTQVLFTTNANHNMGTGTGINMYGTLDYDGHVAIQEASGDTFRLTIPWVGIESGNYDNGSKDEKSYNVEVSNCRFQKSSKNRAYGYTNGNPLVTVINTVDTYQDVLLGGFKQGPTTERWKLVDAAKGIFKYTGIVTFVGEMIMSVTSLKSGVERTVRYSIAIDGVMPTFLSTQHMPAEVKSSKVNTVVIRPISIEPGSTVCLVVAIEGTTDSLVISDLSIDIKE